MKRQSTLMLLAVLGCILALLAQTDSIKGQNSPVPAPTPIAGSAYPHVEEHWTVYAWDNLSNFHIPLCIGRSYTVTVNFSVFDTDVDYPLLRTFAIGLVPLPIGSFDVIDTGGGIYTPPIMNPNYQAGTIKWKLVPATNWQVHYTMLITSTIASRMYYFDNRVHGGFIWNGLYPPGPNLHTVLYTGFPWTNFPNLEPEYGWYRFQWCTYLPVIYRRS